MATITIRQATARDADTLSLLNADVQALHAAALPWWFKPPGPESFPPGIAAVRSAAAKQDITLLGADVWSFNDDARAFFRRHGFTTFNERLWTGPPAG